MLKKLLIMLTLAFNVSVHAGTDYQQNHKKDIKKYVAEMIKHKHLLPKPVFAENKHIKNLLAVDLKKRNATSVEFYFALPSEFDEKSAESAFLQSNLGTYLTNMIFKESCFGTEMADLQAGFEIVAIFQTKTKKDLISVVVNEQSCSDFLSAEKK